MGSPVGGPPWHWPCGRSIGETRHGRGRGGHHDAPVVATGELFVVDGAAVACDVELDLVCVDVPAATLAAVEPVAAVGLGRVTAKAAAPRALAAPAPRVMADTQASPLSRARCRAEPEGGELVMVLQSRVGGRGLPRCWWSMRPRSSNRLCGLWVVPLNGL